MTDAITTSRAIALLRVTSGSLLLTHGLTKLVVFTPAGTDFSKASAFPAFSRILSWRARLRLDLRLLWVS